MEVENLAAAQGLADKAAPISKEVKDAGLTSSVSLEKRGSDASGCAKLPETCAAVKALPDVSTNGFGETRVLALKKGKQQALDLCETNANLLVLLPLSDGVQLTVEKEKPR